MNSFGRALWCPMVIGLIVISTSVEASCNDAALAQQIQQRWQAPLNQAKDSICSTARVMVGMLSELKTTLRSCLSEGETKTDNDKMRELKSKRHQLDQEFSAEISKWQNTKNSVCR